MKVEFKQACEIQGQKFGPDAIRRPGIFEVPGHFKSDEFFQILLKDGKLRILEDDKPAEVKSVSEKVSELLGMNKDAKKNVGKK